jgi:magnesium transporter
MRRRVNRKKIDPKKHEYTGIACLEEIKVQLFEYNKDEFKEQRIADVSTLEGFEDDDKNYWLNTHGIHEVEKILNISEKYGLHTLTTQDILDVNQRPKFQDFDKYWFFSIKSLLPGEKNQLEAEQMSFVLGRNYLISFQEKEGDYFSHVRQRIREDIGLVRSRGVDYLLYLLFEAILDNYFKSLESVAKGLEEVKLMDLDTDPSPLVLRYIEQTQQQIHLIRKTILPIKEFVLSIEREELGLVEQKHMKYFYEVQDLCLTLVDDCEYMDLKLSGYSNLFFSLQGHRMNQVMKTLTIVATIFIPLTFIAGIYGMNFLNMPELAWKWGYPTVWILMVTIFIGMIIYFKRKKWF